MQKIFTPLQVGSLTLPNRIVMAPLTRSRAGKDRIPNELMAKYYEQRATAGLIISEATSISPMGVGYADTPGIWSSQQVEGWKKITDRVHQANGRIYLQLWHVGRISHSMFLDGRTPVAPSAIAAKGHVSLVRPQLQYETPQALSVDELLRTIDDYHRAAKNALKAGFDGVELHGANGYLLDQFLQDSTNQRNDEFGGSIENRAKLLLAVTDAAISVWGNERVGVHLAPRCDSHDMGDTDAKSTFTHVAKELNKRNIAFIMTREHSGPDSLNPIIREFFNGNLIANEGFDFPQAQSYIENGSADAVGFGRLFIANPDLVHRFQNDIPLNTPIPETFYTGGEQGYTDYPFSQKGELK